jgi:hypothetical protein
MGAKRYPRVENQKKFFVLVWRHRAAYRLGIRPWTPPAHLFSGQDRLRRLRALSISVRVLGFIFPCCLQRLHLKSARPQSYLL